MREINLVKRSTCSLQFFFFVNDDGHVIKIFFSKSYMHVYGHPISYSVKVRYNSDENRAGGGIGGHGKCVLSAVLIYM